MKVRLPSPYAHGTRGDEQREACATMDALESLRRAHDRWHMRGSLDPSFGDAPYTKETPCGVSFVYLSTLSFPSIRFLCFPSPLFYMLWGVSSPPLPPRTRASRLIMRKSPKITSAATAIPTQGTQGSRSVMRLSPRSHASPTPSPSVSR